MHGNMISVGIYANNYIICATQNIIASNLNGIHNVSKLFLVLEAFQGPHLRTAETSHSPFIPFPVSAPSSNSAVVSSP